MMSKNIVVTCPNHDLTTRYISSYAKIFIDEAKEKGNQVTVLEKDRARSNVLASVIRKLQPSAIFFNGHGDSDTVCGQDNEDLIKKDKNTELLVNVIVYALSCSAAAKLGPSTIDAGAKAFIGYDADFVFYTDREKQTKPQNDTVAKQFLEPAVQVPRSLIKGNSIESACRSGKQMFRKNMRKLLTSETSKNDTSLLSALYWDMKHLTYNGNGDAVL